MVLGAALLVSACGSPFSPKPPAPRFYTLDAREAGAESSRVQAMASPAAPAPVMIVDAPHAQAGFDTVAIVYVLEEHRLQPYADNQWIAAAPKMLAPLIASALDRTGSFVAVLMAPSPVRGRWELQSDIVRLQHEVAAHRFRFTLRVTLIDSQTRAPVLTREFDGSSPVIGASPAAAVEAANRVVADVLQQLATACADEVERRR